MAITEHTFTVSASALFDTLINPDTYPRWLVGTRHIRSVSDHWPQPSSYFKHTVGFGPIAIPDRTTVRTIDEPRTLEMLVRARPVIEAVVRFDVTPSSSGCTLRMEEPPVGVYKLVSAVAQPRIRARNERSMKRWKRLSRPGPPRTRPLESTTTAPRRTEVRPPRENRDGVSRA